MRLATLLLLLSLLFSPAHAQINGQLDTIDNTTVLTVWGSHHERGYAQGYLLGDAGKQVFDEYFIDFFCLGSSFVYNNLRTIFTSNFTVDARYLDEVDGIILGMRDAGVDLFNPTLGRDITATDILVANSLVDLSQWSGKEGFGCSSLSSWGASTIADPILGGHLVITRHLDWSKHAALTSNAVLTVHVPSEPDEQRWLSLGYAGFLGALSAVNVSGLGAFLDLGNYALGMAGAPYEPILFSVRTGMERADFDGNGTNSPADVTAAIEAVSRSAAVLVQVTQDDGMSSRPVIVEVNNARGVAERDADNNSVVPADNLAVTNHFRLLYNPVYCNRYAAITDSLNVNRHISPTRSWDLLAGAAGQYGGNIMAIQYIESSGSLAWAVDTALEPAYLQKPSVVNVDDLFGFATAVATPQPVVCLEQNRPNPFNPATCIRFSLPEPTSCWLTVYDLAGHQVRTLLAEPLPSGLHRVQWAGDDDLGRRVSSGTYLYELRTDRGRYSRKMLLLE
ncbi:MAG: FlgD immunoglobulin-like domain containing protein [bacterium]